MKKKITTEIKKLYKEDVSKIWHKPTEIPKKGTAIVSVTESWEFLQEDAFSLDKFIPNWEGFVEEYKVTQWAYKSDLIFLKEDKEKIINKACEWLDKNLSQVSSVKKYIIDSFRKAANDWF